MYPTTHTVQPEIESLMQQFDNLNERSFSKLAIAERKRVYAEKVDITRKLAEMARRDLPDLASIATVSQEKAERAAKKGIVFNGKRR